MPAHPDIREFDCAACGAIAPFVRPPCRDGHGDDCPEWTCTRCEAAFLGDPPEDEAPPVRRAA